MNYFWPRSVNTHWGPWPVNTNLVPEPVNRNLVPGSVNTNWGPGPVNTNWGPGPGLRAKQRAGAREIQISHLIRSITKGSDDYNTK